MTLAVPLYPILFQDDMDSELSTGEALVNESVLQSIQRERELEEHKFVIAE